MKKNLFFIFCALSFYSSAQMIACGSIHSLAVCNDSTGMAWGYNLNSQLGNGTTINSHFPVPVNSLTGITAITSGGWHSLALKNDGSVWAWGNNFEGEIGNGTNTNSNVPTQVSFLTSITAIAGG